MQTFQVVPLGIEREPMIVIDGFSGRIEALTAAGRSARYAPARGYPGVRSPVDPAYLALGEPLLGRLLAKHFGLTKRFRAESCSFSMIAIRPEQLGPAQRQPHYDGPDGNLIAMVHYTDADSGGTAFYRHRRTGFETITPDRVAPYHAAQLADDRAYGPVPPRYHYGDDDRYEMIGEIAARADRLIAYRGRQLHSGVIAAPPDKDTTQASARLTINTFLIGEL